MCFNFVSNAGKVVFGFSTSYGVLYFHQLDFVAFLFCFRYFASFEFNNLKYAHHIGGSLISVCIKLSTVLLW